MSSSTMATGRPSASHARLARLKLDFSELLSSPYPGVSIHLDDSDMYKFCLHLCPDSGPYRGLCLHFDVELPYTWPAQPPKVRSSAEIHHPNVFGSWICCDLLKEHDELPEGYTGGYTPALTLRGLFMQFLTFFSSERVEQDYGSWVTLGEEWVEKKKKVNGRDIVVQERSRRWDVTCTSSSKFQCTKCGYGYVISHMVGVECGPGGRARLDAMRTVAPAGFVLSIVPNGVKSEAIQGKDLIQVQRSPGGRKKALVPAYMHPPARCLLHMLNDDTLYEILSAMSSEALLSFCAAYQRAHNIMNQHHILLLRELRCFFLRQTLVDCILGIGVHFDGQSSSLSSDFDWLSERAFDSFHVRRSVRKREFDFFLPLAFSRAHFARAKDSIWSRLCILDDEIQKVSQRRRFSSRPVRVHPFQSIRVLYQFMNNVVVSLMQSTNAIMDNGGNDTGTTLLLASERAVISYCQLYHLLTSLAASDPRILRDATDKIRRFLADPRYRTKKFVPDMGEFIVMASLVMGCPPIDGRGPLTWTQHLNGPLLEEVFVRNVRWTLQAHPDLEVLENGVSAYRLEKTLQSARTGLRLTMFQVAFLSTFVASHIADPKRLGDSYGFPVRSKPTDKPLEQVMVETIKGIYAVSSWPEFFDKVNFMGGMHWGKEKFSQILRDCVLKSADAGYHSPARPVKLQALQQDRRQNENAWSNGRRNGGRR